MLVPGGSLAVREADRQFFMDLQKQAATQRANAPAVLVHGQAPPPLATMIPPDDVRRQQAVFFQAIEREEREAVETLKAQLKQQRELVRMQAGNRQALFNAQEDRKLKEQELACGAALKEQLDALILTGERQRILLNTQAAVAVSEYNCRRKNDELLAENAATNAESLKQQGELAHLLGAVQPMVAPISLPQSFASFSVPSLPQSLLRAALPAAVQPNSSPRGASLRVASPPAVSRRVSAPSHFSGLSSSPPAVSRRVSSPPLVSQARTFMDGSACPVLRGSASASVLQRSLGSPAISCR